MRWIDGVPRRLQAPRPIFIQRYSLIVHSLCRAGVHFVSFALRDVLACSQIATLLRENGAHLNDVVVQAGAAALAAERVIIK